VSSFPVALIGQGFGQREVAPTAATGIEPVCHIRPSNMDYELYHDESKVGGFWHGMLLVPYSKKALLLDYLGRARSNTGYTDPLGIKRVRVKNRIFACAFSWLTIAVAALRSRTKGEPLGVYLGETDVGRKRYRLFPEQIGAKFILFCERDSLSTMTGHRDHASKVETTFRIGLKGGLHFLGEEEEPIRIGRIHFDGHQHLKRHVDHSHVVGRLQGLRSYCEIAARTDLILDGSSDHREHDAQDYGDCQLLQLTDLLIGAFRTVLRQPTKEIHWLLAFPVKSLVDRYIQGFARMQNSRWRNSFCLSECYLVDDAWHFDRLDYLGTGQPQQLTLPFDV
jgi:hypothetical protein